MAEFSFQGINKEGKRVSGKMDASTDGDLRMILRSQGIRPTRITKSSVMNTDISRVIGGRVRSVPTESMVAFTRQLQVLVSSGIPLLQALEVLADQAVNPTLKNVLTVVKEKVAQGSYFWEALAGYPVVFPKLYVALIRAGESSGSMDQMLKRLSRYIEDADRLKKMVKSALMYPIIVVLIGIGVVVLMLTVVIPKFEEILKNSGNELPLPTQVVITVSHFLIDHWAVISGSIFSIVYMTRRYIASAEGKAVKDRILFRAPLFGPLTQKAGVARFARTMHTLLGSGVNLIDAIDICRATIDNAVLEEAVGRIRNDVEAGKTLGSVINKLESFPKMAVQMVHVGESTGNLDRMLEKVADFYEADVEVLVGGLTKLIEPLVLAGLGITVGGLMIAMYLPIFKIAGGAVGE